MKYRIVEYHCFPEDAWKIRDEVFVREQGFLEEFDEIDKTAVHLIMYDGKIPIACSRYFPSEEENCFYIGRLAVIKAYRGKHIGAEMLRETELAVRRKGAKKSILHAQCQASYFYEKQGYQAFGEQDFEESCPHIWMSKKLT